MSRSHSLHDIILTLLGTALLLALCFTAASTAAPADPPADATLAGGAYTLTFQPTAEPAVGLAGGDYVLTAEGLAVNKNGCCCKGFLPCTRKK